MQRVVIWTVMSTLALACGDDGDSDGVAGTPAAAGAQAAGASAGTSVSGSGAVAGTTAGAAAGVSAGSAGAAAGTTAGTVAGMTAGTVAGMGAAGTAAEVDAGTDSGMQTPTATVCSTPVPNMNPGNECPSGDPVALKATLISDALSRPVFVTAAPGDNERLFVVERGGAIRIIDSTGALLATPFIDVPMVTPTSRANDERGLLGMAFHPDYPEDPRFFVNYTAGADANTVVRSFEVSADDPNLADSSKGSTVVMIDQPYGNHNGGMVAFGPDGCLFVGTGDGGLANDPLSAGQDMGTPLGKILRFDVDNPSSAAPGNMTGGNPHIWDYGIRNAWRFSFDRETGDLYIGDVGQDAWEEISVEAAGTGHKNYGWSIAEGNHCSGCNLADYEPAVDEYPHGGGDDCVIGGYVYRGSAIPSLVGWYLHADNGSNRVRAFVWNGSGRCGDRTLEITSQLSVSGDITSFGEGADGELYLTTISGNLYKIEAQ